jgi:hypothetical protein
MNKPNLVDIKLIENLMYKSSKNIMSGKIINNTRINIFDLLKKYWLLLFIISGVIIFLVYQHKKDKKNIKESFTNKKLNKRKKVEKFVNEDDLPPMQYPQKVNLNSQLKQTEKTKCLTCKDNHNIDYKHNHDTSNHDTSNNDTSNYDDQSIYIEEQYNEQPEYSEQQIVYQQPEQPKETSYENQFYGQAITDEVNLNGGGIESFNSGSLGNYVPF